ncbi:MAG: glycosyltransferase involved in cell wall biosynthesis [Neolewinella sp.]
MFAGSVRSDIRAWQDWGLNVHILIIPSWYPRYSGDIAGSFFREQAIALRKHNCKVGVIYPEIRSLKDMGSIFYGRRGVSVEQDEGISIYRSHGINWFARTVVARSMHFLWHGLRLYNQYVADNGTPDIIHVQSLLYAGTIATEINRKHSVPFVVTEHSSIFLHKLLSKRAISYAKKYAEAASRRFAVSSEFSNILNRVVETGGLAWSELPNMVNEVFLCREQKFVEVRECCQFINIAAMDDNKNQKDILLAFAEISRCHPYIKLVLGGDGAKKQHLEALAVKLNIADRIRFTGLLSREQVLDEMAASDAFVLSSRHETFGVVLVEALALGKPVIATRCGGPESIVREQDGLLVAVGDVSGLTNAMNYVIDNYNNYDPVEIRSSCRDRYSESAMASRLLSVYKEVLLEHE